MKAFTEVTLTPHGQDAHATENAGWDKPSPYGLKTNCAARADFVCAAFECSSDFLYGSSFSMMDFPDILGADYVDAWYGSWPDFADAEVMAVYLNRRGKTWLQLYLERPTNAGTSDEAPGGIITFSLIDIDDLSLSGMDTKNRLDGLTVTHDATTQLWRLTLMAANGMSGWLTAREITVDLSPDEADPVESNE